MERTGHHRFAIDEHRAGPPFTKTLEPNMAASLFERIRVASDDGLTGRIALALTGGSAFVLFAWAAVDASPQVPYRLLFVALAIVGLYFVGRAVFSRKPRVRPILLSLYFAPLGVVFVALAMPIAAAVRSTRSLLKQ